MDVRQEDAAVTGSPRWSSKVKRRALLAGTGLVLVTGCSALAGLNADSTCEDWNDASAQQQNSLVLELVEEAEGGRRNPLRETNALYQISSACSSGSADQRIGDISI